MEIECSLVSSEDGHDEYRVSGLDGVTRMSVDSGRLNAEDACRFYGPGIYGWSTYKGAAAWQGDAVTSLNAFADGLMGISATAQRKPDQSAITKAEFLALQRELEGLELSIARGQETDQTDARIAEIEETMKAAPWELNMDTGAVEAKGKLRYEQPIGTAIGGFVVGRYAKMNRNPNAGTIVGVKEVDGRVRVTLQFTEPQPVDVPEGARSTRFETDWRNISSTWAPMLSREQIAEALAAQDESFDESRVGRFFSISELAEKVRSQKNWTMGEVFCCAVDAERFLILKQIAPSSCEMLTISQNGFHDVLTAYRYSQDELVAQLSEYVGIDAPVNLEPVVIRDVINRVPIETVDAQSLGIERSNPGQKDVTLRMSGIYTWREVEACLRDMKIVQKAVDAESARREQHSMTLADQERSTVALRTEQLKIIYTEADPDCRGIAGDRWPVEDQGKLTIVVGDNGGSTLVLLEDLTDAQISERLPYALKRRAERSKLEYLQTDRDNCRVYFRGKDRLFAYQNDGGDSFSLYSCTKAGEPLHIVGDRQIDRVPEDYEAFSQWARRTSLIVAAQSTLPAIDEVGESVDEITECVETTLRAHGIDPGRDWQEISGDLGETQPRLAEWLVEASKQLEEATEHPKCCRP